MPGSPTDFNDRIVDEFRRRGGTTEMFGRDLVLVHHLGARTGTPRIAPLMAIPDGPDAWLIAGSKAGADDHPAWYHNLRAHPDVVIETPDDGEVPVHAEVLEGDARGAAWSRFTAASEGFRAYEQKTTRVIPVIRLTRR